MGTVAALLLVWERLVRATLGIQAGIGQAQARHGAAVQEVLADDLGDVLDVHEAVPDGLGIDDNDGAVLALVEAAGLVGADLVLQTGRLDGVLEGGFELLASPWAAAWTRGALVALVGADEEVVLELWQGGGPFGSD
jgi:hypothetical protein